MCILINELMSDFSPYGNNFFFFLVEFEMRNFQPIATQNSV